MTKRGIRRRVIGAALAAGWLWLCGPARACPPAVLDRIPAEGPEAVIAAASLERLDAGASELLEAVGIGEISTLSQALEGVGMRRGVNMAGSGAVVLLPGGAGAGRVALLVLPVADFGALQEGLNCVDDNGLPRAAVAGEQYWLREIEGGYVLIGAPRAEVVSFPAVSGQLGALEARLGAAGTEVASESALVALAPPSKLRGLFGALLGPMLGGVPALGAPGAIMGDAADPRRGVAGALLERLDHEGRAAVVGVSPGPLGLRLDSAVAFTDGTFMAGACRDEAQAPDATDGLRGLARGDVIFAGSARTSHAGLRSIMSSLVPAGGAEGTDGLGAAMLGAARDAMENSTSAAVAVYSPPSLFSGGLTRTVMSWESDDPGTGVRLLGGWLGSINGTRAGDRKAAASLVAVEGDSAGVFAWSMPLPPGVAPTSPVLFGPGDGPSGLVAVKGKRGYLTWSKDRALLDAALASAGAPVSETLAGDPTFASAAHSLPRHRVIEWYLNVGPLLKQLAPMMGMRPGAAPPAVSGDLPAIGAGLALRDGAMRGGLFVPTPLLKLAAAEIRRGAARGPAGRPAPADRAPGETPR